MTEEKNVTNNNLTELHSSGYEMADGEPHIRGWKVRTTPGQEIGEVDDLLFDTASLRVRYVIVDLKGKPLNLVSRDIILPVGLAELDAAEKLVFFPEVTVAHLATLPEYKKGKVTMGTERAIRSVFEPREGVQYKDVDFNDPDFYNNKYFDEDRMYRRRRNIDEKEDRTIDRREDQDNYISEDETERVPRRKRFVRSRKDEDISEDRDLEKKMADYRDDEVRETDTEKPSDQEGSFAPFQEGAIEIKERAEVPDVKKKARVVEEISIDKEVEERDEKVRDSVRKTEVDIENLKKEDLPDD